MSSPPNSNREIATRRSRHSVRFSTQNEIVEIPCREELSRDEVHALYISSNEYDDILREIADLVETVEDCEEYDMFQNTFDLRGLEGAICGDRFETAAHIIQAVVWHQSYYKNAEATAAIYRNYSTPAVYAANIAALWDEQQAMHEAKALKHL